jgi:predicted glycosyltransferase
MKIIQYCQHVLGIGHFFRSLEICKALEKHQVILVTGGAEIDISLPDHVSEFRLPGLMMDSNFTNLHSTGHEISVDLVKKKRKKLIFELFKRESPDLFIVELYPFGRKAFRFELDPILEMISNRKFPGCRVICSLRDILVEKKNPEKYERRVIDLLNRYFDALLIHADSNLIKLNETFTRVGDIAIPVVYTGFVAPKPEPNVRKRLRQRLGISNKEVLIVASAGGGKVGAVLMEAVLNAFQRMDTRNNSHLIIITGPFMDQKEFDSLQMGSDERIKVVRFTSEFLSYLTTSDLSVSMAGYNTCMNILATRVPALVWPFHQNQEQRIRAKRLAGMDALQVLSDRDLHPDRLSTIMDKTISRKIRPTIYVDLEGAGNSAEWIER